MAQLKANPPAYMHGHWAWAATLIQLHTDPAGKRQRVLVHGWREVGQIASILPNLSSDASADTLPDALIVADRVKPRLLLLGGGCGWQFSNLIF